MDIQPSSTTAQTQPVSDDQELAKALAGITNEAAAAPADSAVAASPATEPAVIPTPAATPVAPMSPTGDTGGLEGIKQTAISELRPLIDHVDLPPDEKFDTYLLLIRSTDDSSLIEPAHTAAQAISDEKRRAQALLDVIKEIDYLSHKTAA